LSIQKLRMAVQGFRTTNQKPRIDDQSSRTANQKL